MISTNNYDFLFSNMQDGICITNSKGQVEYLNNAAGNIFNCSITDTLGKRIWSIIPVSGSNDDFMQLFIDCVTEKHKTHQGVVDYEDAAGNIKKLRICMHYAEDREKDTRSIVFTITDLTELVRVNKAFARYTSKEIAKYVLESEGGEDLGGDIRQATILMSDLRGFTALSTRLDPDNLITMLNHYFECMSSIIEKYHGTIVEFLGDGLFVIFNAPNAVPEHAEMAVACALEMERSMRGVNEWNALHGFPELHMGIGINTGDVVVGNIGSSNIVKYGCIGENANLAGRVESFTIGGQIYISELTRARIKSDLTIIGEHSFLPKGAREEITIYDIAGISGSHGITYDRGGIDCRTLSSPEAVQFRVLEGKAVDKEFKDGTIRAVSDTYAILSASVELYKSDNILIDIGGDIYAKVIMSKEAGAKAAIKVETKSETKSEYVLCFTSKPPCFEAWISGLQ